MRGEHDGREHRDDHDGGIIPAYAGNTLPFILYCLVIRGSSPHTRGTLKFLVGQRRFGRDHPRIRGEHFRHLQGDAGHRGIIPAYAGNTGRFNVHGTVKRGSSPHTRGTLGRPSGHQGLSWDHPRIRGEHSARGSRGCPTRRDHPRIRGEHESVHRAHVIDPGIIPAYAGNTSGSACGGAP